MGKLFTSSCQEMEVEGLKGAKTEGLKWLFGGGEAQAAKDAAAFTPVITAEAAVHKFEAGPHLRSRLALGGRLRDRCAISEIPMSEPIHVTVWSEYRHEKHNPHVADIYPDGIHEAIAAPLRRHADLAVRTATLDEPEHGLSEDVIDRTDVMLWWGHMAHPEVSDAIAEKVHRRVLEGMGLIVLHSAHYSKVFKRLMGTTCSLKWRVGQDKERIWNIMPAHPIAQGLPEQFELASEEMYGEPFGIPTPDELIFISWFTGGEVFRSGATWYRGHGRVFFFRPGHETYRSFYDDRVQRVIANAVRWARPTVRILDSCPKVPPLEPPLPSA